MPSSWTPHQWLPRHELHRCLAAPRSAKATHVLERAWRRVLRRIGALDGVPDAWASRPYGANPNLTLPHLDRPERIVEERPIPSAERLRPRPRKHTAAHDDGPDPDEAMAGPRTRADAEYLALVDRCHDWTRQSAHHP